MKRFTKAEIQGAIDALTDQLKDHDDLLAVEFESTDTITLRYRGAVPKDLPKMLPVGSSAEGTVYQMPIHAYTGPDIVITLGDVEKEPPREVSVEGVAGEMGGDQCRNVNSMNQYGTISFYAGSAIYEQRGSCNVNMRTSPVLISNNHVIARSNAAQLGEGIWAPGLGIVAVLDAFLPLNCNRDLAFGQVTIGSSVQSCWVRGIGSISTQVQEPRLGEDIRKYGARTGYTGGIVHAQSNINVEGNWFRGVYKTSRGFGCNGDSGSVVVSNNNRIMGLYSWGETTPCEDDPAGWFWPFPTKTEFASVVENLNPIFEAVK